MPKHSLFKEKYIFFLQTTKIQLKAGKFPGNFFGKKNESNTREFPVTNPYTKPNPKEKKFIFAPGISLKVGKKNISRYI